MQNLTEADLVHKINNARSELNYLLHLYFKDYTGTGTFKDYELELGVIQSAILSIPDLDPEEDQDCDLDPAGGYGLASHI